jgi:hypothetical protein
MRLETALDSAQNALGKPVREGRALLGAFKAALQALRDIRHGTRGRPRRSEDDDALFI